MTNSAIQELLLIVLVVGVVSLAASLLIAAFINAGKGRRR